MSNLIEDAVQALRNLPDDVRDAAARAILSYETDYNDELQLSDDQVDEVEQRAADPNREFISLRELDDRIHRLDV